MLKLVSKFAMDIFPSVIATILGAYIVNHYINTKPPAAEPPGAASTADPKADSKKAASRADSKPAERSADLGNAPEPGVRAKGISEKSVTDKSAADKAVVTPAEKADHPAETASIPPVQPADPRRHQTTPRDKSASKAPAPAAEPVVTAPVAAPPAEATAVPDANDLARAAIERLRGADPASRAQDNARVTEPPKVVEPPHVAIAPTAPAPAAPPVAAAPSLQPLPPPILVSTPPVDSRPPPVVRADDPLRPTPPADIPDPHAPLDLRADATVNQPAKRPSVADDVLSATKKLFNSVLPKQQQDQ
jgi:hypothetical protein